MHNKKVFVCLPQLITNKKGKYMKQVLKHISINEYIAIKKHYCESYNTIIFGIDFYKMLQRRLKWLAPKDLAIFLIHELNYHYKEFNQFQ